MPERYKNDRANKRSNNGDALDIDITDAFDDNNLGHQTDTDDGSDDRADDAKRESPTNDRLSDNADNSGDYQVNNKIKAKTPDIITNLNGNAVCNDGT